MIVFLGHGIDIVELDEFRRQFDENMLNEIFSPAEVEKMPVELESRAARFCAKEAFVKAVSPLNLTKDWHDFQIVQDASGSVRIECSIKLNDQFLKLGRFHFALSLSHTEKTAAAAVVVIEDRE